MAIQWGTWEYSGGNGMRVGVDVTVSAVTTDSSSVTFTYKVYTENQYQYADPQVLTFGGSYAGASTLSFTNNVGSTSSDGGGPVLRVTKTYTYTYGSSSYGSSPGSVGFSATISGAYNGVTPTKSVSTVVPARPYDVPATPTNTSIARNNASATLSWTRVVSAQAPYTSQQIAFRKINNDNTWDVFNYRTIAATDTSWTINGMPPGTLYQILVQGRNSEGGSAFTAGLYNGAEPLPLIGITPTVATDSSYIDLAFDVPDMWVTSARQLFVERSVNGGAFQPLATIGDTTATTYRDATPGIGSNQYRARYYLNPTYTASGLYSVYVVSDTVTTIVPPVAPTAVVPANGATVTKPNPSLSATLAAPSTGQAVKAEWQFSVGNTFAAGNITVTEANADLNASGVHTENPPITQLSLSNGTWFVRARTIDEYGNASPWTSPNSFSVNTPPLPTPTGLTPADGSTVNTMQPTLGLTFPADSAGRLQRGEWQLATNPSFTSNLHTVIESSVDYRLSGATTEVTTLGSKITFAEGVTWYVRGRAAGNDGSASPWTAAQSFTLSLPSPPVPTAITPTAGSTVTSSQPTLGATLGAATENRQVKAEWQLASDVGFTTNVRNVVEPSTDLRASGATTEQVNTGNRLFQGLWYLRARAVDEYGQTGVWSSASSFSITHQPSASPISPTANETLLWTSTPAPFTYMVSDPDSTDRLTAIQIVFERNDTGVQVYDTGKVAKTTFSHNIIPTVLPKDVQLRWKIRAWDGDDVVGPYSAYGVFNVAEPPIITMVEPLEGQAIGTGRPTVTWGLDSNTVQKSRRIVIRSTSNDALIYDTQTVATSGQSWVAPLTILDNNKSYYLDLTVTDTQNLSSTLRVYFTTSYVAPDTVQFIVNGQDFDDNGYILVDWSQQAPDGFFVAWNLYRRIEGYPEWELVQTFTDQSTTSYKDWLIPNGLRYEYAVTQSGGRSGLILESSTTSAKVAEVQGTHYWLIAPYSTQDSVRLSNVTADSYNDDYEEQEVILIGRGRKVNRGTRLGYSGQITAQLRDSNGESARIKREKLQLVKLNKSELYLRTPFGDLFQVSVGNLSISRIAGVGTNEFVDVTIPYSEIF
jgi:hypothetical protein